MKLNEQKVALTVGLFVGGAHLAWSLLIATGLAQQLIDFVFWVHMLSNPYQVAQFNASTALLLVVVTFVVGCVGGYIFATLWNAVHKK